MIPAFGVTNIVVYFKRWNFFKKGVLIHTDWINTFFYNFDAKRFTRFEKKWEKLYNYTTTKIHLKLQTKLPIKICLFVKLFSQSWPPFFWAVLLNTANASLTLIVFILYILLVAYLVNHPHAGFPRDSTRYWSTYALVKCSDFVDIDVSSRSFIEPWEGSCSPWNYFTRISTKTKYDFNQSHHPVQSQGFGGPVVRATASHLWG